MGYKMLEFKHQVMVTSFSLSHSKGPLEENGATRSSAALRGLGESAMYLLVELPV